jgi:hypothetical protein
VRGMEQTSKTPEGIVHEAKRQTNLHTTPGRMSHHHSALSFADIYDQSRAHKKSTLER